MNELAVRCTEGGEGLKLFTDRIVPFYFELWSRPLELDKLRKGELIMKNLTYFIMSVLLVTLALGVAAKTAMAQDLVK